MLALALILATAVPASGDRPTFGGRVGLNLTHMQEEAGWHGDYGVVGIQVGVPIREHFWLQPDVSFARKAIELTHRSSFEVTVPFVNASILAIVPARAGRLRFYGGVGPSIDFRVGGSTGFYDPQPDTWRRIDFGLSVAAGLSQEVSDTLAVTLESRFIGGMRTLAEGMYGPLRLRTLQFCVGVEWHKR